MSHATTMHRCDQRTGTACIDVTARLHAAEQLDWIGRHDLANETRFTAQRVAWAHGVGERPKQDAS